MIIAEFQDITKDYSQPASTTPTRVLDQISLAVTENVTIAIMGPSGSGKTTLLNLLGTLDRPTSGKVFRDGIPVEQLSEKQLSALRNRSTGFIFQQHLLLPQLTVLENVLLPVMPVRDNILKKEAGERALMLAKRVGLKDHLHHYPARLSVGECQRTAIVRALINRPKLLLADEPTGSLDARNAAILADLLAELHEYYYYSLVLVTHDNEVARRMEVQYRLQNGELHLVK